MSHDINIKLILVIVMSIGSSGRIVIEIEPRIKQELHEVLRLEGTNLKAWFLTHVQELLAEKGQQAKGDLQ